LISKTVPVANRRIVFVGRSQLHNMASSTVEPDSQRKEKKHKRDKSEHKKKRAREEDAVDEPPRKPKRSKSEKSEDFHAALENEGAAEFKQKKKKKKKKKHRDSRNEEEQEAERQVEGVKKSKKAKSNGLNGEEPQENGHNLGAEMEASTRKKSKKHKHKKDEVASDENGTDKMSIDDFLDAELDSSNKRKHKDKMSKKERIEEATLQDVEDSPSKKRKSKDKKKRKHQEPSQQHVEDDAMDLDDARASSPQEDPIFPFFTQAVSLYVPFFPIGFEKPLTNVATQHLDPLLNHYSPTLGGVLLSYSNLNLSDRPVMPSVENPPTDETPALLRSVDEYAVGFGWLSFDAQLFVPSRGKWMEGVIQLQNEGHVGVVCWSKFNASIEAKRLPRGWTWVDLAKTTKSHSSNESDSLPSPDSDAENASENQESEDMLDGEELQVVEQMHTTGYWVDERGRNVSGKLRFRIKNFDVGLAGDYGYLSIEGTCLDEDAERALAAEEREAERKRRSTQNARGLLRPMSRRVPEFSMTKLGKEEQEEDSGQRTVVYKGSRPGTPDD